MSTDTRESLLEIEAWLNERFVHREESIEALTYAALTRSNLIMQGPPGTAKSMVSRAFGACLQGRTFVLQLHQFTTIEDVEGQIDMAKFTEHNIWERNWRAMLPEADFVHFDEIDKAGPAVYGPLLTILNERIAKRGGVEFALPYLFAVGTMNAMPDDPTGAFYDRWLLRTKVDYVGDGAEFQRLLDMHLVDWSNPPVTSVAAIRAAHPEIAQVKLSEEAREGLAQLRGGLRAEGIVPSDRRFTDCTPLVQASAWLRGSDEASIADLAPLRMSLWVAPEQADLVAQHVLALASPHAKEIREIGVVVDSVQTKLAELKGMKAKGGSKEEAAEARSTLTNFAVTGRAELNRSYKRLVAIYGESGTRERAESKRLAERLPDIAVDLVMEAGLMTSREAAKADVAAAMPAVGGGS